jgi:uncharacterized protein YkwD
MRKLVGFLSIASTLVLVGCTGEVVDDPTDELDETIAGDLDPEALISPDETSALPAYCNGQTTWDTNATSFENQVLTLVNQKRAAGATCGGVAKPPVAALASNASLRCAARLHSKDMVTKNFFSHTGSNGSTFSTRITQAGYTWTSVGENIAAGQTTPAAVVTSWMASTGHCNNIMNGNFKHLGVGYVYGASAAYKHYWTQDFGKP